MQLPFNNIFMHHARRFAAAVAMALGSVIVVVVTSGTALAMNASPHAFEEAQPDGTPVRLHIRGNEYYHWFEDMDGYTVLVDGPSREYRYARRNPDGRLGPSQFLVGRDNPQNAGLVRRIRPALERIREREFNRPEPPRAGGPQLAEGDLPQGAGEGPETVPPSGTVKNLVVLVRFSDHTTRTLPSQPDFNTLFNTVGGHTTLAPTGSLKDVYTENSYGTMTLESTAAVWVTVPQTESWYANGNSGLGSRARTLIRDALDAVDSQIDFSQFDTDSDGRIDSIAFIHSGYGAEWGGTDAFGASSADRIWSHRWDLGSSGPNLNVWTSAEGIDVFDYHISPGLWGTSGTGIGHIGVIAHETGHFFGLPDLYDTQGTGAGIGSYGLMANSWGFDGSQLFPPHFSPWSKIFLGWVTPTLLGAPGVYNVSEVETNAQVYRIDDGYPSQEYILVENRQPTGFDGDMPQGGLAIWHIDDSTGHNTEGYPGQAGWPGNGDHYRVALLQADGNYDLERDNNRGDSGDVYHGGNPNRDELSSTTLPNNDSYKNGTISQVGWQIFDVSNSSSNMQFTFGLPVPTAPTITSTPSITATVGQPYQYDADGQLSANGSAPITFGLTTGPAGFAVSSAGAVTWTPTAEGSFPVEISATNGTLPDASQPYSITVFAAPPPRVTQYSDDFESASGWSANPLGTDTASTGQWERANPQSTTNTFDNIDSQLGTTVSGSNDLVTEGTAGGSYGANDVDGGTTSIRSPEIILTNNLADIQLSFWYYLAHASNSSSADFLRVTVVGASNQVVLDIPGAASGREAAWAQTTIDISSFAGDTIRILVEAADASDGSIVEAAIDDMLITAIEGEPVNQAPNVEAGSPQTINYPTFTQVSLDGTVSDDDLPTPGVTTLWTVTAGNPTNVSFGNASLVDTTATFTAGGQYTLTLTANDSEPLQNSDDILITVNTAPTVEAGGNQIITLPTPNFVDLNPSVTDDGLPLPPSIVTQWTVVGGTPANVTFGEDSIQDTTATFSEAGTYTLRITANDGLFTPAPFDDVVITVNPEPPGVNDPPVISILTSNQAITMPTVTSLAIDGNVTDDGLPTPPALTTITWSVSSGDATKVNFNPGDAADTIATFTVAGTYTLRLTADDGGVGDPPFAEITITVDGLSKEDTAAILVPILDLLDD